MTTALERARAAIASADEMLARRSDSRPETVQEWAARAPEQPEAIGRWLREQPADEYHPPAPPPPPPPPPAVDSREISDLRATIEQLRAEVRMLNTPKERRRRKMGRAYLTADTGGR